MFGHWWDLEQYQQIIERIGPTRQLQSGYNRPVYIYNIVAADTIDELVIQSRTDKRKIQDLLLEAARKA
jgi:SNF2 family DNA or RNA helicase